MTAGLVALVAEKAITRHHDDVVLHVLTVLGGAQAVGLTSEQLQGAMFRAKAATWFRGVTREKGRRHLPSLIQGAAVQ